ncbi:MAG: 30S ribosomal protein S6 [Rickettsiales bacterium]|jgi:small subunit ribosomal protein S6|nr:30S ribosomal protein S6 [Rickettsiales bacterium]
MPFYELVYVARQDLTAIEVNSLTDKFESILKENGGKIVSKEYWGLRNLAYPIKKNTRGHYALLNIDSSYPAVKELERIMGFNENVLRKGIFKLDALSKEPSELAIGANSKDREYREKDKNSNNN